MAPESQNTKKHGTTSSRWRARAHTHTHTNQRNPNHALNLVHARRHGSACATQSRVSTHVQTVRHLQHTHTHTPCRQVGCDLNGAIRVNNLDRLNNKRTGTVLRKHSNLHSKHCTQCTQSRGGYSLILRNQRACIRSKDWRCRARVTPARSPWRAHVACIPRLRQRQSFSRMLVSQKSKTRRITSPNAKPA